MKSKSELKSKSTGANKAKPLAKIAQRRRGESAFQPDDPSGVTRRELLDREGWYAGCQGSPLQGWLGHRDIEQPLPAAIAAPLPEDVLARLHDVGKFAGKPLK
jgi:hypothetical protein